MNTKVTAYNRKRNQFKIFKLMVPFVLQNEKLQKKLRIFYFDFFNFEHPLILKYFLSFT